MPLTNTSVSSFSTGNSLMEVIPPNSSFVGAWEDTMQYAAIYTLWRTDVSGTLYYQFSLDGKGIDRSFPVTTDTSDGNYVSAGPRGRYFRVTYTNDSNRQSYFRMQTTYSKVSADDSHGAVAIGVSPKSVSTVVRAVLHGLTPGGTYSPVRINADGTLGGGSSGGGTTPQATTPVFKVGSLVTASTGPDQVILSYTPGNVLRLSSVSLYVRDSLTAYQTFFGEASIESPPGTKLYTAQLTTMGGGKDSISLGTTLPANQQVRVVCSPSGPVSEQTWNANLVGALVI